MDASDGILGIVLIFCVIGALCIVGCYYHDTIIYDNWKDDSIHGAKTQYIIQAESNMTGQEKIDLIHSICTTTFTNETLRSNLRLKVSTVNIPYAIKTCECELMKI